MELDGDVSHRSWNEALHILRNSATMWLFITHFFLLITSEFLKQNVSKSTKLYTYVKLPIMSHV